MEEKRVCYTLVERGTLMEEKRVCYTLVERGTLMEEKRVCYTLVERGTLMEEKRHFLHSELMENCRFNSFPVATSQIEQRPEDGDRSSWFLPEAELDDLFVHYVYNVSSAYQKSALDHIIDGCELPSVLVPNCEVTYSLYNNPSLSPMLRSSKSIVPGIVR
ncbi:hypothetical protein STEG23_010215, partial [Scotinomys teguina]